MVKFVEIICSLLYDKKRADIEMLSKGRMELETILNEAILKQHYDKLEVIKDQCEGLPFSIAQFMESAEKQQGDEANIIFDMGYTLALYNLITSLSSQKKKENKIVKARSGYRDVILKFIYDKGPILHKDLAGELGISISNLSNVIQRIQNDDVPLIQTNPTGKYKYYLLTEDGREYVENRLNYNNIFITEQYNSQIRKDSSRRLLEYYRQFSLYKTQKEEAAKTPKDTAGTLTRDFVERANEIVEALVNTGWEDTYKSISKPNTPKNILQAAYGGK